jgi:hypothetical protein
VIPGEYSTLCKRPETFSFACYSLHMNRRWTITCMFGMLGCFLLTLAGHVSAASSSQQTDSHKGITVEDVARGVRSAVQNIEKEIPKIGPAIGKTVQSIGANSSEKARSQNPPADKK